MPWMQLSIGRASIYIPAACTGIRELVCCDSCNITSSAGRRGVIPGDVRQSAWPISKLRYVGPPHVQTHIRDRIDFLQIPRLTDTCQTTVHAAVLRELSLRLLTWLRRLGRRLAK